ncbi:MAG: rhodanese-like domain-containing protein, partial [Planctomycetota bacterium]
PFLDARLLGEFEESRVPGAMHVTPAALSSQSDAALDAVDLLFPDAPVVIYCYGGDCEASEDVAILLENIFGFTDVRIMVDSFESWQDAGFPIESGPPMTP